MKSVAVRLLEGAILGRRHIFTFNLNDLLGCSDKQNETNSDGEDLYEATGHLDTRIQEL